MVDSVKIPVSSDMDRCAYAGVRVLAPFWAFFAPVLAVVAAVFSFLVLLCGTQLIYSARAAALSFLLFSIWTFGRSVNRFLGSMKIVVTEQSIGFPACLGGREFRWAELTSIFMSRGRWSENLNLQFGYKTVSVPVPKLGVAGTMKLLELAEKLANDEAAEAAELLLGKGVKPALPLLTGEEYDNEFFESWFRTSIYVPLEPGMKLGHNGELKVLKQLSMSAMSSVYLVVDNYGVQQILKESVQSSANDESKRKAEAMFDREAALLSKLSHSGLAQVYDYFVQNDKRYILMEKLNGMNLRAVVKQRGRQSISTIIEWSLQIAEILDYLHSQEPAILHRDLSPENVILGDDNKVRLIDFGVAAELNNATGTVVGKLSYMAPEQYRGRARPESDLYSLGCLMYFLASGEDPIPLDAARCLSQLRPLNLDFIGLLQRLLMSDYADRPGRALDELLRLKRKLEERARDDCAS